MEKECSELTPEEKREKRFQRWLAPEDVEFVTPEAERKYKTTVSRLIKAINLEEPDRLPAAVGTGYIPAAYAGYSIRDVTYDISKTFEAWTKFAKEIELDVLPSPGMIPCGQAYDTLGIRMYKWAGHGLPDDQSPQYVESDYMKSGEWEHFLTDRADYHVRTYLPRTLEAAGALAKLPPLGSLGVFAPGMDAFLDPEVLAAFKALGEAGRLSAAWRQKLSELERRLKALGLPPFQILVRGGAPLDNIGAFLRGTTGTIMDMYRCPDLIHEYMERAIPEAIEASVKTADMTGIPVMSMPLHRGADNFMNEEQFHTFYWPYLKRVMLGQIEEGLVPCCFAEGSFNSRLEIIKDFPKGKAVWYFDQTDMKRAKEIVGDTVCIMGNVPVSLMVTGQPEDVKAYCRQLIEDAGPGGGFVLAPGATTDDAKVENIQAMMAAAKEFGVYSK
jgi:hypothetical protein